MGRIWIRLPRWLRYSLLAVLGTALLALALAGAAWWYFHPPVVRSDGIVYGQRHGQSLCLDVIQPPDPNGAGIVFIVSGGWKSSEPGSAPVWTMAPLVRRGYTVFPVYHVSQPRATVMEIIDDVHRAVRFIRHHAADHGVDPQRIGVSGGSAGGHLSLMLATRGGPASPSAEAPDDQVSSEVQAVAIFYPPTDLLNLGESTENPGDGGPPKSFVKAFGPESTNLDIWKGIGRECSPIYHITSEMPPILIHHGDADTLVPLEQSEWFRDKAASLGREVELVIHPGKTHGWPTMVLDLFDFADWFDEHL